MSASAFSYAVRWSGLEKSTYVVGEYGGSAAALAGAMRPGVMVDMGVSFSFLSQPHAAPVTPERCGTSRGRAAQSSAGVASSQERHAPRDLAARGLEPRDVHARAHGA